MAVMKNLQVTVTGLSADWWLGLAPDDSPLVLRQATMQEIYALEWEAP